MSQLFPADIDPYGLHDDNNNNTSLIPTNSLFGDKNDNVRTRACVFMYNLYV